MDPQISHVDAPPRLVPIVTPIADDPAISGKVRILHCQPTIGHKWVQSYVDDDGRIDYAVSPRFARKGYVLLRDLFIAEDKEADWLDYEKMLTDIAAKRKAKPFPDARLPAEVHRRRACGFEPAPVKPANKNGRTAA